MMEKKYACIIWFQENVVSKEFKNIYTGMGECIRIQTFIHSRISRKYGTVYCFVFVDKKGCSIPDYQLFDTLYHNADVVVVATPVYLS